MKNYIYLILVLFVMVDVHAQPTLQDTLNALSHEHTPVFSGSGDESIVCYKSTHRDFFFCITGLIVAIALILFKLFFFNRRMNRILREQNVLIEEKNKNITDSINYAKRLQNAILPSVDHIDGILSEYFILYQPKDIVSGDFYWVSEHGSKIIVAAVDCTGHGVPGALLSIVGHNALYQTVNELGIVEPAKVLATMDSIIRKMLHQGEYNAIKDGMDMALCVFDKESKFLEYAGANNPLYIVSESKLSIIKASKLTVGTIQEQLNRPENQSVQLKKGDSFYLFSDGFADQFGGADNKKFKSRCLQDLILSLSDKSMKEQRSSIFETFKNWKGRNEQVDDVLVIGIRV